MVANKYAFLQITRRRFLNEWEAFKKVISRRNIRRRITIPLTLSNLKLLRRITRTENILHRNFRSEERRVGKECRYRGSPYHEKKKKTRYQHFRSYALELIVICSLARALLMMHLGVQCLVAEVFRQQISMLHSVSAQLDR